MALDLAPRPLPLVTAELSGTGGASKVAPEDFAVEELPAYEPCGTGEHLYLFVEKRDLSTSEASRILARAFGVNERDVGYAGQKDRRAVTRQWFSLLTTKNVATTGDERLRIVRSSRHGNKLRLGHLSGNRFTLVIRDVQPEALPRAEAVLSRLSETGLPNFYGTQRFGRSGDNALLGAALLGLCDHPEAGRAKRDRFLKRLALSALQSELFNRCLTDRLVTGTWDAPMLGDVLKKRASGGSFTCESVEADTPRVQSGELDVTGPMPGPKERPAAKQDALAHEERILEAAGVPRAAFAIAGGEAEGSRRPYRIALGTPSARLVAPNALELSFALPAGSYATRVLAEVMKGEASLPGEDN